MLGLLFCLMAVVRALGHVRFFLWLGEKLAAGASSRRSLRFVLVSLAFFSSMFITNDVALITFVPFTIELLHRIGAQDEIIPVVVWETTAANLGSMLTPVGNPQNLYLYQISGMAAGEFLCLMLPFTLLSFILLGGLALWKKDKPLTRSWEDTAKITDKRKAACFGLLFFLCLLVVGRLLPEKETLVFTAAAIGLLDKKAVKEVDYILLATFTALFIFIGNLSASPAVRHGLEALLAGRELWISILLSQIISNVPAAMLLAGFTDRIPALIIGTNIGGLGTLIASMASLISYRFYGQTLHADKKRYLLAFTWINLALLAILSLGAWVSERLPIWLTPV